MVPPPGQKPGIAYGRETFLTWCEKGSVNRDLTGNGQMLPERGESKEFERYFLSARTAARVFPTCPLQSRSEWTKAMRPLAAITKLVRLDMVLSLPTTGIETS